MSLLFWRDGALHTPNCPACDSSHTTEDQDFLPDKLRDIYIKCYACGARSLVGRYEHVGDHQFIRVT